MPKTLPRNPAYTFFGKGYPCRHHKKWNKDCKPYDKWDTSYCDFQTWWQFCMKDKNAKKNFTNYRRWVGEFG